MAHSYTKLNIHIVFATWDRLRLIPHQIAPALYAYMAGILRNASALPLAINGMEDHVHILARVRPTIAPADLLETLKSNSSRWMNQQNLRIPGRFRWQGGYGAFSVSEGSIPSVTRYIERQQEHHRTHTFEDEFLELLELAGIDPADLPGRKRPS